jgi:diguanylate cyclase (GGDEF)-like protein
MADAVIVTGATPRRASQKILAVAMFAVVTLHAGLLLVLGSPAVRASRLCTAAIPILAAGCALWRARRLPAREQLPWMWLSATLLLWATGHLVETFVGHSSQASNLAADPSDIFYLTAAFPLLLAIARTSRTESIQEIFLLDLSQVALAFALTYYRLFRMSMPAAAASSAMLKIYIAECVLLSTAALLRLVSWSTLEERRRMRWLCTVLWIYLPVELSMDYATDRWHLRSGTLLDLLWSVPFLFAGWGALYLPMDERPAGQRKRMSPGRMLIESLCPMLITAGIFVLAASIMSQHPRVALGSIFWLLLVQGLHAGVVQANYLEAQNQLLERGEELKQANAGLERLSQLDPLTGISNRRLFTAALEDAWMVAIRRRAPIAVLMIDVDFFKGVNDLHGHAYGDECLISIAKMLTQETGRPGDLPARYGGEEFILLLPQTDSAGANTVAERMQKTIAVSGIVNQASPFQQKLTVSIGIGVSAPQPGMDAGALVKTADEALYEAKRTGRNRICARIL